MPCSPPHASSLHYEPEPDTAPELDGDGEERRSGLRRSLWPCWPTGYGKLTSTQSAGRAGTPVKGSSAIEIRLADDCDAPATLSKIVLAGCVSSCPKIDLSDRDLGQLCGT